jgi:hypothetical protein
MSANISATSTDRAAAASPLAPLLAVPFRAPSRLWLRGAFYLAGAAQLITISALLSADPEPATWAMLLLAVAPVLLAAAAAFTPAPANVAAAVAGVVVLVVGLVGAASHTGWFFAPAVAALAVGAVKLWRERTLSPDGPAQSGAVSSG